MRVTKRDLDAQLTRILGNLQVVDDSELGYPVNCVRCKDSGVVMFTGGTHRLLGDPRARRQGREVDATPDKPVFKRCACVQKSDDAPKARRYS